MIKANDAKLTREIIKTAKYQESRQVVLKLFEKDNVRRYFFREMPRKHEDLKEIDYLLDLMAKEVRAFDFVDILKHSVSTDNAEFILQKIKKHYFDLELEDSYQTHQRMVMQIVKDILDKYPQYIEQAHDIVIMIINAHYQDYRDWKSRRDYEEEKKEVGEILNMTFNRYVKVKDERKIDEIVRYIKDRFNFIDDDSGYMHFTPPKIFKILRQYIEYDPGKKEARFDEIKRFIVDQYSKDWQDKKTKKTIYEGWELSGAIFEYSGSSYQIGDKFYVEYIFKPVLENLHKVNITSGWQFIKKYCITSEKKVSQKRPDFLNRAALPIIIERYLKGSGEEVKVEGKILEDFVTHRKGVPDKAEIIFNSLRGDVPTEKLKPLVYKYIEMHPVPGSPMIYQLLAQLAAEGDEIIIEKLKDWIVDENFTKRIFFGHEITILLRKISDENFSLAKELFEKFVFSGQFAKRYVRFDVFELANFFQTFRYEYFADWLRIQNKLLSHPELQKSDNLQILLCFGLAESRGEAKDSEEILMNVYNEFIKPNILDKDIKEINKLISHHTAREAFVQFAERLAKNKRVNEALDIINRFIDDPDPFMPGKDPEQPKEEYNEHNRIASGEEHASITSVRGWCAWSLMHCAVVEGRGRIDEIFEMTKKLLFNEEGNFYLMHMACFPLSQLARNRLTVLPKDRTKLYLNTNDNQKLALEKSMEIEETAFEFLEKLTEFENKKAQVVLTKSILQVFNHIRALNQKRAERFVDLILKLPDKSISQAVPMLMYFALFRLKDFKDWKWKEEGLYDDLDDFNHEYFSSLIEELIHKNSDEINEAFSWHFHHLPTQKEGKEFDGMFDLAVQYLKKLIKYYDQKIYGNVYYFLDKHMDKKFDECLGLYEESLKQEAKQIKEKVKLGENLVQQWWPNHYHGKLLLKIKEEKGDEEFVRIFKLFTGYPKKAQFYDLNNVLEELTKMPKGNKDVGEILEYFGEDERFFEYKEKWLS